MNDGLQWAGSCIKLERFIFEPTRQICLPLKNRMFAGILLLYKTIRIKIPSSVLELYYAALNFTVKDQYNDLSR